MQLYENVGGLLFGMVVLMWRELVMFSAAVVVYVLFFGAFQVADEPEKEEATLVAAPAETLVVEPGHW